MSWIANAESGSSVRAKLNALMIPISSASISSPVEYVDIALPGGYSEFRLSILGLLSDTKDNPVIAVSPDAGVTFFCDQIGFDDYNILQSYSEGVIGGSWDINIAGTADSVAALTNTGSAGQIDPAAFPSGVIYAPKIDVSIDPGSATHAFCCTSVYGLMTNHATNQAAVGTTSIFLTKAVGRQNLIRVSLYGNEDINPPTSGEKYTGGTFVLFGLPA